MGYLEDVTPCEYFFLLGCLDHFVYMRITEVQHNTDAYPIQEVVEEAEDDDHHQRGFYNIDYKN